MVVEKNAPLQPWNTFGIVARAQTLVRVRSVADLHAVLADPELAPAPKWVLGGGSNIILTGDVKPVVLKMEIKGLRLVQETDRAWIVEAGAGEVWHDAVAWTLAQGFPGLENLALIPGTVLENLELFGPISDVDDACRRAGFDDVVVVDTAGRLHTKTGLMDELGKVKRVIEKKAPVTEVLLVLDEFARLGHAGVIARGFSYVAGYGLRLGLAGNVLGPDHLSLSWGMDKSGADSASSANGLTRNLSLSYRLHF
mgnify:CR=1 FL=1